PIRKEGNATISPRTVTSAAKTVPFAASIPIRRGTASRLDQIIPVEYSLLMTRTPSTHTAIWPRQRPESRMVAVGVAMLGARAPGVCWPHWRTWGQEKSIVNPMEETARSASDEAVERPLVGFAHADRSGGLAAPSLPLPG